MTTTYLGEQDLLLIGLGCAYIQANKAVVDFPTSTRAHPSEWVVISRNVNPPVGEGADRFFPFKVSWDMWQYAVVPLMQGDGDELWVQFKKGDVADWETLVRAWAALLREQVNPTEVSVLDAEFLASLIGEPILRGPLALSGDSAYPVVDPQLAWIDGHQRLQYPEVD